jgi:hypothetical protein
LDELVSAIAMPPGEPDQVTCSADDSALLCGARDSDSASATKLEQTLVAELAQRAENGVRVDAENRGQVTGRWQALTGECFAIGDCAANLGRYLSVEVGRVGAVDLDMKHGTSNTSVMPLTLPAS